MTRPALAGQRLSLAPLTPWNLPRALWITRTAFRGEWGLTALTYLWHLLRSHGLPCPFSMVTRRRFWLRFEESEAGTVDVLKTRIHDPDTRWVIVHLTRPVPAVGLAAFLLTLLPRSRVAILQVAGDGACLEQEGSFQLEGSLPGSAVGLCPIYSLRRNRVAPRAENRFHVTPREPLRPRVHTDFSLLRQSGRSIGVTGLYVADWWPRIAWGGWGALRQGFAHRGAAKAGLLATQNSARKLGLDWFCLETSSSPQYRIARRLYESCGMQLLVRVDDFFREGRQRHAYLVYGRNIGGVLSS